MTKAYDGYYRQENLFGEPYPELVHFFEGKSTNLKVLDLGSGQGRNTLFLARLGFEVTGIDSSKVGVNQMLKISEKEKLTVQGFIEDIYQFNSIQEYDVVLLDSMFHFEKKDKVKEVGFLKSIAEKLTKDALLVICIQNTDNKRSILQETLHSSPDMSILEEQTFDYTYKDNESAHVSCIPYQMVIAQKNR
jgi:tellurite methyltransferase